MRRISGAVTGLLGLSVSILAVACSHHTTTNTSPGELGNGTFHYVCVEEGDALCTKGEELTTFPDRIATGGLFDAKFVPNDSSDGSRYDIVTAAAGIIEENAEILRAKAPGVVALLAKRTSDSRVMDFIHVHVVDVANLRLDLVGGTSVTTWSTGTLATVKAKPVDENEVVLAGGLVYTWTTSDPRVLTLEKLNPTSQMDFMPRKPGTVTVTVTAMGHTESLDLTIVKGTEPPPEDAGVDSGVPPDSGGPPLPPRDAGGRGDAADASIVDGGRHD